VRRVRTSAGAVLACGAGAVLGCACGAGAVLVVEVDGYGAHSGRAAFERDHRRTQELAARGIQVSRVTWRQLTRKPEAVVALLASALATASTLT
jgi:very-short-patch-repair endonuclease